MPAEYREQVQLLKAKIPCYPEVLGRVKKDKNSFLIQKACTQALTGVLVEQEKSHYVASTLNSCFFEIDGEGSGQDFVFDIAEEQRQLTFNQITGSPGEKVQAEVVVTKTALGLARQVQRSMVTRDLELEIHASSETEAQEAYQQALELNKDPSVATVPIVVTEIRVKGKRVHFL